MRHPCVELYFDIETTDAKIRIWMKTNNELVFGHVEEKYVERANSLRDLLVQHTHDSVTALTYLLERQENISAFQISLREDWRNLSVVVYKEWP